MSTVGHADESILRVDDLCFELRRSARRKTIQITVDRGGELVLSAPPGVAESRLRQFALDKRLWIYTKLAERERLQGRVPIKEYVDGEGFLYLGRSYRLRLVDGQALPLKLAQGRFLLRRDATAQARDHFVAWYCQHGLVWLKARVAEYSSRMEVAPTGVKVQELGYRWGSCGKGDWLYFHWKTALLPARIAEYVAVHEIAHLHVPHHTPAFWRRVARAMPDFVQRKVWLAEHGSEVEWI